MWAVLFALAVLPADDVAVDRVDLVEVSHVYDGQAKPIFLQLLFWDWSPSQSDYKLRSWKLMKSPDQRPVKDWRTGEYVTVFADGGLLREVRAGAFRETWMQADPELHERDKLPKENRRGLLFEREPAWNFRPSLDLRPAAPSAPVE